MFEEFQGGPQVGLHDWKEYLIEIKRNMIVMTVFLLIMNPTEFRWLHNQKETCRYNHVSFKLGRIISLFLIIYSNKVILLYRLLNKIVFTIYWNQIVLTILQLIWNQTEVRLIPN